MLEQDLQTQIKQYLKARGAFAFKVHVGSLPKGRTNPAKGCPDLICVLPGGYFLGVEVKAPSKNPKIKESQKAFHSEIKARGGHVIIAMSIKDVEEKLDRLIKQGRIT